MQTILRFIPGVIGSAIALTVLKLVSWTDLGFEIGAFFSAYLVETILVERGMQSYRGGSA
jgi:uncharacterized membrane protein YeaQ/YmgE (transglycosylase-associated protein family)